MEKFDTSLFLLWKSSQYNLSAGNSNKDSLVIYLIWLILPFCVLWSSDFLVIYIKVENIIFRCMISLLFSPYYPQVEES